MLAKDLKVLKLTVSPNEYAFRNSARFVGSWALAAFEVNEDKDKIALVITHGGDKHKAHGARRAIQLTKPAPKPVMLVQIATNPCDG